MIREILYPNETGWACLINYSFNLVDLAVKGPFVALLKINNCAVRAKPVVQGDDSFVIGQSLLNVLPKNNIVSISVESTDSPGVSLFEAVSTLIGSSGSDSASASPTLPEYLSNGYVVDHWGNLCKCFGSGDERKRRHVELFSKLDLALSPVFGGIAYVVGGNLLGLIRDGAFLDHDDDIDVAVFLGYIDAPLVNKRFFEIHDYLCGHFSKDAGFSFQMRGPCHIGIYSETDDSYMDVFAAWVDPELDYYRFSGVGGYWGSKDFGFSEIDYLGLSLRIPHNFELELDITYGPGKWRIPDKNFVWKSPEKAQVMKSFISSLGWNDFRVRYPQDK